ncbi:Metalloenzyme, LuxS/M16 peptidase-like protein [Mycena floridula]|nr:Metalloenzyme, LuxS/M16 peptidase-like protein [Mycena floridula]
MSSEWCRELPPDCPPFSSFTKSIQKSQNDDREYRLIRLDNGLEALLIHDATAEKAAASLDVAVGHLSDPDDMPGLAHFCEHLLFMGTEQFPIENEYRQFLAKNNGKSNAFTSSNNTNYHFSVASTAFPGALARFSGFFHSPLFKPSATTRELNAVNSENKKNLQLDSRRLAQLKKHLSVEGHPWRKFGTGNTETLLQSARELQKQGLLDSSEDSEGDGGPVGRETRRRLVEWWQREYCASRMHVCILGTESLDELVKMTSQLFSPIVNRMAEPLTLTDPFGTNEKCTLVAVQTVRDYHSIEIVFPLEWQAPLWELSPASFISHLLGHEGYGSLHSYLKQKGWISSLGAGRRLLVDGFDLFAITMILVPEGFENYRSVILDTFKYIAMLRESLFPAYLHQEEVVMSGVRFQFKEKGDPESLVSTLSARMIEPFPRDRILSGPALTWPWSEYQDKEAGERKLRDYLETFRLENCRVLLAAKADNLTKLYSGRQLKWESEPWYGTQYFVERLDDDFIREASVPNDIPHLFLPRPNEFVPTKLDVEKKEVSQPLERPILIRETPLSTLWHKKDDRFWVPKAHVIIDLRSSLVSTSARAYMLNHLYADLVADSLTEYSYAAELAGLSYQFSSLKIGLLIKVNGYNDKVPLLTEQVLAKGKSLVVNPKRFAVFKEKTKRSLENFLLSSPHELSGYNLGILLATKTFTIEEKLKELPSITAEELQEFIPKLFSAVNMRILITGNIGKDKAIQIAEIAERGVGIASESPAELNLRTFVLPKGCNYTWTSQLADAKEVNCSLSYFVRFGPTSNRRLRVTAALLAQILKEPAFTRLRTEEQLGYIVHCQLWKLPGGTEHGMRVTVQSEKPADHCEARVEAFFDTMKRAIEEMTPAAFAEHKSGMDKKWREPFKNLAEETAAFRTEINTGLLDFQGNSMSTNLSLKSAKNAEMLVEITKDDVLALFIASVHPSSTQRSKLSVHSISQKPRSIRVSIEAATAFEASVKETNLGLEVGAWKTAVGDEPTIEMLRQYWSTVLDGKGQKEKLLQAFSDLVEKHPFEVEELSLKTEFIQDIRAFQRNLTLSEEVVPVD